MTRSTSQRARATTRTRQTSSKKQGYSSVRIGDIDRKERAQQAKKTQRRASIGLIIALIVVVAFVVGGIALYNSSLFKVENVSVTGVEHLTATEVTKLAAVPEGTTLLQVDRGGIEGRMLENPWVQSVAVNPVFPDTLELAVTERPIAAIVEVSTDNGQSTENWAISPEGIWLMLIPNKDSKYAAAISSKIYEDAEQVRTIVGVPHGVAPQAGAYCSDETITNALAIIDGLTTELADQIKKVEATGAETTTLTLDNGVEIAFGLAEDIREKERVCLQLMEENPDRIAYINVRVVDRPTYRAIGA